MDCFLDRKASEKLRVAGRSPKCTRCRNHGKISDLRGHKHKCAWRNCSCSKCLIVSEKQKSTAARIALYRHQTSKSSQLSEDQDDSLYGSQGERSPEDMKCQSYEESYEESIQSSPQRSTPEKDDSLCEREDSKPCSPAAFLDGSEQYKRLRQNEYIANNLDIMRYIFPFYDISSLEQLLDKYNNDILHAVLALCQNYMSYPALVTTTSCHDDHSVPSPDTLYRSITSKCADFYHCYQREGGTPVSSLRR